MRVRGFAKKLLVVSILTTLCVFFFTGAHLMIFQTTFTEFEYPMFGDIHPYVMQLRNKEKPSVEPINSYNYEYLSALEHKCDNDGDLRVAIIIKSAMANFEQRTIIRNAWGYEKRFSDVPMRTVFILGVSEKHNENLQFSIEAENKIHKDIVQADFHDQYYNNTIKTMMGFKWAATYCKNSKYYLFLDDDIYLSVKNLLRFLRNPLYYPKYIDEFMKRRELNKKVKSSLHAAEKMSESVHDSKTKTGRNVLQSEMDYELPSDAIIYAGFVVQSRPQRHYLSKWFVSLEEYPYNKWPPYVPAGAYVMSREALNLMYYGSFYVKHFRFDDIYLAILAKKMGIQPFHSEHFYFFKDPEDFKYVIAYHSDKHDIKHMLMHWNEQKSIGNA